MSIREESSAHLRKTLPCIVGLPTHECYSLQNWGDKYGCYAPLQELLREACAIWVKGLRTGSAVPTVCVWVMEQTEALAYKGIHSSLRDPSKVALRLVWSWLNDAKVPVVAWSSSLGGRWFCQMFLMMASLEQLCFCLQSSGLEASISLQMPALSNSSLVVSQL